MGLVRHYLLLGRAWQGGADSGRQLQGEKLEGIITAGEGVVTAAGGEVCGDLGGKQPSLLVLPGLQGLLDIGLATRGVQGGQLMLAGCR